MDKKKKIKVFIVDDHSLTRGGFASLIKEDDSLELIAEASRGDEGLEKILKNRPDIAVIDIKLPDISGLELSKSVMEKCPGTNIIILTGYPDEEYFAEAMNIGVSGYFLKDETDELAGAIKKIHSGETFLSPKVHGYVVNLYRKRGEQSKDELNTGKLTSREMDILKLISENKTNLEIGEELFIEKRTVETHRNNIREKLGLIGGGRHALLLFALQNKTRFP